MASNSAKLHTDILINSDEDDSIKDEMIIDITFKVKLI